MEELLDQFTEVREELIGLIRRFPASKRTEQLFHLWSLKEVVAHLAGWDRYFTDIVAALESGEEPPYWKSMTKFNEASLEKRKDETWDSVFAEFVANGEAFVRCYKQIPQSLQHTRFWKRKSYTPAQVLEINIHHYKNDHLSEIKRVLSSLQ
jgi:hypothetical protein